MIQLFCSICSTLKRYTINVRMITNPIFLQKRTKKQLSYDYTMQFIDYDSIQTRFISYRFQIRTKRSIHTKESGR